jgi:tripartite ATP-independent transporter DctM subunit
MPWIGLLFALFMLTVPIGTALLATGLAYLGVTGRVDPIIGAQKVATGVDSFPLMAIPFFLFAAELMNHAGITDRIFRLAKALVGGVAGGLGYVNVLASMMFASMSGSAVADAVGLGRIEIRAMRQDGYEIGFAAAITAASTTVAPILPPSISLVIYGVTAGTSIGALFLAGILPGILMGLALMVVVWIYARRHGYGRGERVSLRETGRAAADAAFPLMMPLVVVGGIWGGIFTPTEAGAVAVAYALVLGMAVYRTVHLGNIGQLIFEAALSSANILFIIAVSSFIGWILTMEQVPLRMAAAILDWSPSPAMFLLMINGVLLVLGCFMAAAPVIIMLTPIILPTALAMGIDPVHLGVVMVLNLMIGLITPPVGLCLFAVAEVAEIPVLRLVRAVVPFLVPLVAVLLLITFVPDIVLFLPRLWGYRG